MHNKYIVMFFTNFVPQNHKIQCDQHPIIRKNEQKKIRIMYKIQENEHITGQSIKRAANWKKRRRTDTEYKKQLAEKFDHPRSKTSTRYLGLQNTNIKALSKKLQQNRVENRTINKLWNKKDEESLRGKESFFRNRSEEFPPFWRSPWIPDRGDGPEAFTGNKRIPREREGHRSRTKNKKITPEFTEGKGKE